MTDHDPIEEKTDEELAREARAGSRRSFEELARRYKRRLFVYLRPRVGSDQDAEDMVQETFLKLYRNIGGYDPAYRFSTWLYTSANRLAIDAYRKKRGRDGRVLTRRGSPIFPIRPRPDAGGTGRVGPLGRGPDARREPLPGPLAPLRRGPDHRRDRRRPRPDETGRPRPAPQGPDELSSNALGPGRGTRESAGAGRGGRNRRGMRERRNGDVVHDQPLDDLSGGGYREEASPFRRAPCRAMRRLRRIRPVLRVSVVTAQGGKGELCWPASRTSPSALHPPPRRS